MTEPSRAVFLSYASQDSGAAQKISEALRTAGIEVWFDQSELRGGDAWDQKIRGELHDCALFMPVISANTVARHEGYFRLEWDLADQRTHMIARNRAFIVPVCVDATPEASADIPESFHRVQWTRLPGGATPAAFVERIHRLLSGEAVSASDRARAPGSGIAHATPVPRGLLRQRTRLLYGGIAATVLLALGYFGLERLDRSKPTSAPMSSVGEKSIAVLPFVDMSENHDQEYLADGMAEQILDLLAKIPDLKVIGRTSSFSFKGKQADLPSIGKALGVAYLVEGSVRRSGDQIRVTAQLIDARDGSHRWSDSFDGTRTDVLRLQDEIAVRVAHALNLGVAGHLPPRGSINPPEAYDYYLRGLRELEENATDSLDAAYGYFEKALALAPDFAPAAVGIAGVEQQKCANPTQPEIFCPRALASVDAALKLDPTSADAYAIRAEVLTIFNWDWPAANAAASKAAKLGTGVLPMYAAARVAYATGDMSRARQLLQQILATNPFEPDAMIDLGFLVEMRAGNFELAESWMRRGLQITPRYAAGRFMLSEIMLMEGKLNEALDLAKQEKMDEGGLLGLAVVYSAMGRKADSDTALTAMESNGYFPSDFARVYAFRGDSDRAMNLLQRAYETHDPTLWYIKGDPLVRSLEKDPRYKAFLRKMNLPE